MVEVDFVFDSYTPPLSDESDFVFSSGEVDPTAISFTAEEQPLGGEGLQFTLTEDTETVSDDLSLSVEEYNNSVDPTAISFSLGAEGIDDTLVKLEFRDQDQVSPTEFDLNLSIQEVTVSEFTQSVVSTSVKTYDYPLRFESASASVSVEAQSPEQSSHDQSPASVSLSADEHIQVFYPTQLKSEPSAYTPESGDFTTAETPVSISVLTRESDDHGLALFRASVSELFREPRPDGFLYESLSSALSEYSVTKGDHLLPDAIVGAVVAPNFNSSVYTHVALLGSSSSLDVDQSPAVSLTSVPTSVVPLSLSPDSYGLDEIETVGTLESQDVVAVFGYTPVSGGVKAYVRRPVFGTSTTIGSATSHEEGEAQSYDADSPGVALSDYSSPGVDEYARSALTAYVSHLASVSIGDHTVASAATPLPSLSHAVSEYSLSAASTSALHYDSVVSVYDMATGLAVAPDLGYYVSEYEMGPAFGVPFVGDEAADTLYDMAFHSGYTEAHTALPTEYDYSKRNAVLGSLDPESDLYIGDQLDATLLGLVRGPEGVHLIGLADSGAFGYWLGDPPTATKGKIGLWMRSGISTDDSPTEIWTGEKDPSAGLDL